MMMYIIIDDLLATMELCQFKPN